MSSLSLWLSFVSYQAFSRTNLMDKIVELEVAWIYMSLSLLLILRVCREWNGSEKFTQPITGYVYLSGHALTPTQHNSSRIRILAGEDIWRSWRMGELSFAAWKGSTEAPLHVLFLVSPGRHADQRIDYDAKIESFLDTHTQTCQKSRRIGCVIPYCNFQLLTYLCIKVDMIFWRSK